MSDRRRLSPRLEIELPAGYRVTPLDELRAGTIANLSVGGAAVVTRSQLPPNAILDQFRFTLPEAAESEPIVAAAAVVHARPLLDPQGTIEYCSGVHFLGLETSAFERLERFVLERLEPTDR